MIIVRRLIWDAWNISHIALHEVTPDEVEEVCHGDPLVQQGYKGRIILIGLTAAGKMLAAVLDSESADEYYPVTARPASRKERVLYQKEKEGDGEK